MPLARAAAERALEIDPTLPEALATLASCVMTDDYNWKEAERLFKLAMAREPIPPAVRFLYGEYLFYTGRPEAALKEMEPLLQEDPLNLLVRNGSAAFLLYAGRDRDAEREIRLILELDENYFLAYYFLCAVQHVRGEFAEALASAEKAYALAPWHPAVCGALAALLRRTGDNKRAEAVLAKLGDGTAYAAPVGLFVYHVRCSEIDQAADWAEKAIEQRAAAILNVLGNPTAEALRRSSRWPKLARMMNLPDTG
jgi:serine/threonine-protein kinase